MRAFLVHHDLCHRSLLSRPGANAAWAPCVGALVSTTPSVWSREHDRHHKDSNNLDRAQDGQTASWTVGQYLAAPAWQRWVYWALHHRPVLFGVLPALYFFGFMRVRARWHENAVFAAWLGLLWWAGWLEVWFATVLPAATLGFLIFHAQHTFEGAYRRREAAWDFVENGLYGSSWLQLPSRGAWGLVVRFFTYNIGYHHVHHLHPRIAGYALERAHHDRADLFAAAPRVTLGDAVRTMHWALYDEARACFVGLRGLGPWRARPTPSGAAPSPGPEPRGPAPSSPAT